MIESYKNFGDLLFNSGVPFRNAWNCHYCGRPAIEMVGTPFMADVPAYMCRKCWKVTKENSAETIPDFDDVFKNLKS